MSVSTVHSSPPPSTVQQVQRFADHLERDSMPFARPRKQSGLTMSGRIGSLSAPSSSFESSNDTVSSENRRRSSAFPSFRTGSRRQSQMPESGMSSTSDNRQLPVLNEARRMNLRDIMIWRRFTRNLKQRVVEKQNEQRTFCWLDRSASRGVRKQFMPMIEAEPTYRMEPDEKPSQAKCKEVVDEYLEEKLKGIEYEQIADSAAALSRKIADETKEKVKSSVWARRYKCVVYVTLGQKMDQGVQVGSLCAWDPKNDSYVTCSYQNNSLFCIVTVYAVYLE